MRHPRAEICLWELIIVNNAPKQTEVNDSLLKTVVLDVGLGRGLYVETADLDESSSLLSIRSTDIFEVFAESVRVIENGVVAKPSAGAGAISAGATGMISLSFGSRSKGSSSSSSCRDRKRSPTRPPLSRRLCTPAKVRRSPCHFSTSISSFHGTEPSL